MSDTNKAYTYKRYACAVNYIEKHKSWCSDNYEIDVFACIHKNLPVELKGEYK